MKKAKFKTYGSEVAYAMFRLLFIIVPVSFVLCLILFSSLDSGGGFISFSREASLWFSLVLLVPPFLTLMTLLWSINYLLCRLTHAVKARPLDVVFHVLSVLLAGPGVLALILEDPLNDLLCMTCAIPLLWSLYGICCGTLKIQRLWGRRRALRDENQAVG